MKPNIEESKAEDPIKLWRTRWNRWLGAKTRRNESEWTTLLDINFIGWASRVAEVYSSRWPYLSREEVKALYRKAIASASLKDFRELDSIFCEDQFERRFKR